MNQTPLGYKWRSSSFFIQFTIGVACCCHLILHGFIVPILPYMLEHRLQLDPSKWQTVTSGLLATHSLASIIASPIMGYLADKSSDKKGFLIWALVGEIISSALLAMGTNVPIIFLGRIGQAVSGIGLWVVGSCTLVETVGPEKIGTAIGYNTIAVNLGVFGGPIIGGLLLEQASYAIAWSVPFTLLVLDLLMRLVMIENPQKKDKKKKNIHKYSEAHADEECSGLSEDSASDEIDPLINQKDDEVQTPRSGFRNGFRYYFVLLRQPAFAGAIVCYMVYAIVVSSLEAILPLHVQKVFDWQSLMAGTMFLIIQVPATVLSPLSGWIRDRLGSRYPSSIALLSMGPVLWLMGTPNDEKYPWAHGHSGKVVYIISTVVFGTLISNLNGLGATEGSRVVRELEIRNPKAAGPNGGYSKMCSIVVMSWTVGSLIGPVVSGSVSELYGYSNGYLTLGILCLLAVPSALLFLGTKSKTPETIIESDA